MRCDDVALIWLGGRMDVLARCCVVGFLIAQPQRQEHIILAALEGSDIYVNMPTGAAPE